MAKVEELVHRIDTSTSASVNEVRIIQLEHSLAQDVATILQSAIGTARNGNGTQPGQQQGVTPYGQGGMQGQQPGGVPGAPGTNGNRQQSDQREAMLRFLTVDAKGRKLLNSGILSDVRITADVRANALVVSSPPENLELLEALIRQLDQLPAAEAQIKVFTIVNGDATNLADMLKTLFTGQSNQNGQQQMMMPMIQTSASGSETSLVPLRFGVDTRTNSIIASGTMADLRVAEAILTRLDDGEVRHRKSVVFRLKNSPASDVANTVNQFLTTERQFQQATPGLTSAFEQIEREVVVVPEPVSNSLVLSATPRFFDEVKNIIEQLDARPPMVMIQVLIAEIDLGNTNEFGIELGLQDSVLFDRSILSNPVTTSVTNQGVTSQQVISANQSPGFNFNNGDPLGNSGIGSNLNSRAVGGQGLSNFSVGRQNSTLGYGGLVLSAASENVSVLLRALAENHRVEILQRPQVMTLDNQPAFIQVGKRVPRITGVSNSSVTGQTNSITLDNVGLILGVTPRISPDGLVVMQIDAEKSELESDATGIPVFTSSTGQVIRSPIIDATTAQTTVSALSDQTVVLGGLIAKNKNETHRKVPWLGDVPFLGALFRYDSTSNSKTELLIIMTPHIVKNEADADAIKRAEAARMNWCMCDVTAIYGEAGLRRRCDEWSNSEVKVVYPDVQSDPTTSKQPTGPEPIATPSGTPNGHPTLAPKPANAPANPVPANPVPVAPTPTNPPLSNPALSNPALSNPALSNPRPATQPTAPAAVPPLAPMPHQTPSPASGNLTPVPDDPSAGMRYGAPQQQQAQYSGYPQQANPGYAPQAYPGAVQPAAYQQAAPVQQQRYGEPVQQQRYGEPVQQQRYGESAQPTIYQQPSAGQSPQGSLYR
jgi:type II secretion system protein D